MLQVFLTSIHDLEYSLATYQFMSFVSMSKQESYMQNGKWYKFNFEISDDELGQCTSHARFVQ